MLSFNKKYFFLAFILFIVEVLIAAFFRDGVIRPYVGDYLVVMLLYCAVRAFIKASYIVVCIAVLLYAYLIETLQYFHLLTHLGFQDNLTARLLMGYGFDWIDIVAYTLGVVTVIGIEWASNAATKVYGREKRLKQPGL